LKKNPKRALHLQSERAKILWMGTAQGREGGKVTKRKT